MHGHTLVRGQHSHGQNTLTFALSLSCSSFDLWSCVHMTMCVQPKIPLSCLPGRAWTAVSVVRSIHFNVHIYVWMHCWKMSRGVCGCVCMCSPPFLYLWEPFWDWWECFVCSALPDMDLWGVREQSRNVGEMGRTGKPVLKTWKCSCHMSPVLKRKNKTKQKPALSFIWVEPVSLWCCSTQCHSTRCCVNISTYKYICQHTFLVECFKFKVFQSFCLNLLPYFIISLP